MAAAPSRLRRSAGRSRTSGRSACSGTRCTYRRIRLAGPTRDPACTTPAAPPTPWASRADRTSTAAAAPSRAVLLLHRITGDGQRGDAGAALFHFGQQPLPRVDDLQL